MRGPSPLMWSKARNFNPHSPQQAQRNAPPL
jgi:hypothetical protein